MKINNLDVTKYKRFFAFGCSFTNYKWMTWADIIGNDIEFYENWGEPGAGNHFIFNSFIEADARYNFNKDDLIIIFWSTKEREDRYLKNKWIHDTSSSIEETYGTKWVKDFYTDLRSHLIRDAGYMKAVQTILNSKECDWANLLWYEFFNSSELRHSKIDKELMLVQWRHLCKNVYDGGEISDLLDDRDVINLYQDVFSNISGVYKWFENECIKERNPPNNDNHPMPNEALMFIDWLWPNNNISRGTRNLVKQQDLLIEYKRPKVNRL